MTAINDLGAALRDKNLPIEEAGQACQFLINSTASTQFMLTNAYNAIVTPLFKNWPHAAVSFSIKGKFYYEWAWKGRGNGYANQVTPERWKLFSDRLAEAEKALNRAWNLNPRDEQAPTLMISVIECQQKKRGEMETWFDRAMISTRIITRPAAKNCITYTRNGMARARICWSSARQCVQSTLWGGDVPLILVDAHLQCARLLPSSEQEDYWRRPEVWPNIKAAYDKFFQLNPQATHVRNYYAWYAGACEQWQVFNEQIALLKEVDFGVFNGKAEYDKMVNRARAARTNP